ncbi:MAG: DUF1566 domain-containing protein [Nitrospirae bacterium]|nr:DUF1566 domain-containing protein [Nitrospirota bacterium]
MEGGAFNSRMKKAVATLSAIGLLFLCVCPLGAAPVPSVYLKASGAKGGTVTSTGVINGTWNGFYLSGITQELAGAGPGAYTVTATATPPASMVIWSGCDTVAGSGPSADCIVDLPLTADKIIEASFSWGTPPSHGSGAAVLLPQSGQFGCYDESGAPRDCLNSSQDGEHRIGVAWPTTRFKLNAGDNNNTVADQLTGLTWFRDGGTPGSISCNGGRGCSGGYCGGQERTWQEALDYVACLNGSAAHGHADWRMPNAVEMMTLINHEVADISAWLNGNFFVSIQPEAYWTSTTDSETDMGTAAWYVDMLTGEHSSIDKTFSFYALPVRSGGSGVLSLAKTGQSSCYNEAGEVLLLCTATGQDVEYRSGTSWPAPRFIKNSDGTITDRLTGLDWSSDGGTPDIGSCPGGGGRLWIDAIDYVGCLNTINFLGYNDWRLPNKAEAASLVSYGALSQPDWLTSVGFSAVPYDAVWTSTSYGAAADAAWALDLSFGGSFFAFDKAGSHSVIPVRAGSGYVGTPLLSFPSGPHNFGIVMLSKKSPPWTVTLTNSIAPKNHNNLYISAISLQGSNPGEFLIEEDNCSGMTIAPNGTCTFDLRFAPDAAEETKHADVIISSNDAASPAEIAIIGQSRIPTQTLTVSKTGNGYVTSNPEGIDCGVSCTGLFGNETVTLTAVPDPDSVFSGWSGACDSDGKVTMDTTPRTCTATFDLKIYNIGGVMAGTGGGLLSFDPASVIQGNNSSCLFVTNAGYMAITLNDYYDNQSHVINNPVSPYPISNVTCDHYITVTFSEYFVQRIAGGPPNPHLTFAGAYAGVTASSTLLIKASIQTQADVVLDKPYPLVISGGYNMDFSDNTNNSTNFGNLMIGPLSGPAIIENITIIDGALTISGGPVTIEKLVFDPLQAF